MDRTKLKNYAPQARREFIQAMIDRAAYYGLTADKTEPAVEKGDVAVIGGRSFPIAVARKRKALEDRIKRHGFQQTMDAMAYTWFNRLVAIRYMELHGYLDHGYRILSHPEGKPTPEILEHAEHVEFPGLKKDRVIDLKLAGNKEGELFRLLLNAQCNALHSAMPFLFERIDHETELLLPDNLLNSDSLIRKLVNEIDESDWQEVEIIGWLYQFYISERKDEVIGKVVASEDIPAATQLFTPNWIVKYLVQNTLGRQWLATYPDSPLRQLMEYYIEPAEQTPEVQEQLKAITPASLNPEELTLLDPACGSGHILVEAYNLFKAIYQERGYRAKDIPALILQKNLFGLEIDDRAAQLAAFALLMKARADDRRIFDSEAKPNILAFEDSQGMKASDIYFALTSPLRGEKEDELESSAPDGHLFETDNNLFTRAEAAKAVASRTPTTIRFSQADVAALLELFENAKTFGTLIQVPPKLAAKLPEIEKRLTAVLELGDLTHASAQILKPLLVQASLLARQYDAVVANPPYMGRKYMTTSYKDFAKRCYPDSQPDVASMFVERCNVSCRDGGHISVVCPFVWMFLVSYEPFRAVIRRNSAITSLIQLEYNAFEPACVPVCSFTLKKQPGNAYRGTFIRLSEFTGSENQAPRTLEAIRNPQCRWRFTANANDFLAIPTAPIAYWTSDAIRDVFKNSRKLGDIADCRQGMATANNDLFLRRWFEVDFENVGLGKSDRNSAIACKRKWFPYNKGGSYRKWYGNNEFVVNWENDGEAIASFRHVAKLSNVDYFFRQSITWTASSSSFFGVRHSDEGFLFDVKGSSCFPAQESHFALLAFLASKLVSHFLSFMNPTIEFQVGNIATLPVKNSLVLECQLQKSLSELGENAVRIAREDWDSSETSWGFNCNGLLAERNASIIDSLHEFSARRASRLAEMQAIESQVNSLLIAEYGLSGDLTPTVTEDAVTLDKGNPEDDIKRLLSYAIGCVMGRYSLDKPGLIYAHSGNQGFDADQYKTFRADDDGIIPLLETDWGIRDDATNRFVEFIVTAWPKEHLEANLKFVADSLGPTGSEQPRDTIRRYLATGFYKHHLPMYKKRPIYWLFSSGKQRAFQCLVYLHRYNEGTLARMRTEYVIPLQGQISARIEQLEGDKAKATSTSHRTKIQKEQDKLKKQQTELAMFEEKLKHYADMRISLDLDDGVKVNYAKFGDLLAEAKAITGGKDDE
jgi:type II restriction/modification system DNA methylase subunit YeeA